MVDYQANEQRLIQTAKSLFKAPCVFVAGAQTVGRVPQYPFPEVAFWGRSNVGKSSLLNSLVGSEIARTSNTPGRTQQLNFFNLADKLILVDMPGYGFANVPLKVKHQWEELIAAYFKERDQLKCLYLLIDARHGFKTNDREIMRYLDISGMVYQVVLTKADKIPLAAHFKLKETMEQTLENHPAAKPFILLTSTKNKYGIQDLQNSIAQILV